MTDTTLYDLREGIIHNLRTNGWSRVDAEDEADQRIELIRARLPKSALKETPDD